MSDLWRIVDSYITFDPKHHSIADVMEIRKDKFLPYYRNYKSLNRDQLLELIGDAKKLQWQALDLSRCNITELPDELWELSELRILYIGNRNFIDNRESCENRISKIPRKIERLQNLRVLSLSGLSCKLEGNRTYNLPNLVFLDIFDCYFPQIPIELLIPSIECIGFNCLENSLSHNFTSLVNLKKAYLGNSLITTLPDDIDALQNLEMLSLFNSKIKELPSSMCNLERLNDFVFQNTPLEKTVPPEICHQSAQEIVRYIISQQSNAPKEYFNESKLIIVGQGSVGKTSLLKRIVKNVYDEEETTEGINISEWTYTWNKDEIRLNVWDFGGQEIYHSTHQFFLTKRSLYLLVWDVLAEKEYGRIDYWLRTIQSLADNSPIIIVVNKCDRGIGRIDRLDFKEYKSRYPQIQDVLYVSCKDNININRLRKLIKSTASNLPLMRIRWLKTWMDVRRNIERVAHKKESISYSTYQEICRDNGILDEDEALSLIKYLHDLGVVLYYHDDPLLQNLVILSSEWGTDAVYKVVDEQERTLKGRNGILFLDDLSHIWKNQKKYPRECYPYLLNLMEKFQLAFRVDEVSYLIAELLNNESIELDWDFHRLDTLSFRYEYDFLPAGVMTRLIVSANKYLVTIDGVKQCWKNGAYLFYRSAKALVRLYNDFSMHYIQIDIIGKDFRDKREFLNILRNKLDEINNRFSKIKIKQKIPCCCSEDCPNMFDYQKLLNAERIGKETVECQESWKDVPLLRLLDGIESRPSSDRNNVYNITINYSDSLRFDANHIQLTDSERIGAIHKNKALVSTELNTLNGDTTMEISINQQLVNWANSSPIYNDIVGESLNNDCLKKSMLGSETEQIIYSYKLMELIWKRHPQWGIMPNYSLLSEFEHAGKFYTKYRDHLAHMFKVFLMGLYLYENTTEVSSAFERKGINTSRFVTIWSITALYHDIGYVFDTLDKAVDGVVNTNVCEELVKILKHPLHQLYDKPFTEINEEQIQKDYRCFVPHTLTFHELEKCLDEFAGYGASVGLCLNDEKENNPIKVYFDEVSKPNIIRSYFDHGISSSMILIFMQKALSEYIKNIYQAFKSDQSIDKSNPIQNRTWTKVENTFESLNDMKSSTIEAAKALALHNINHNHSDSFISNLRSAGVTLELLEISLSVEPFAYLLRVCDELQCWDRPYLSNPIATGTYLRGDRVRIIKENDHVVFSIDDNNEKEKIKRALDGIINPPITNWIVE